jgi:uncharacterized membrane protein
MSFVKKIVVFFILVFLPMIAVAQEATLTNQQGYFRGKVERIIGTKTESFPNSEVLVTVQDISARIVSGDFKGQVVEITNDFSPMKIGDTFWGQWVTTNSGATLFAVSDFERRWSLLLLVLLFAVAVVVLGKIQGLRSLMSLTLSILAIIYILIPLLLKGWSPIPVTIFVGALVLFFAIFLTHGFHRISAIAFGGTIIAVAVTSVFASIVTKLTHMTGFATHEAIYLNFNTGGELDFVGIFLASIIIGMLGVLDDISITQVAVVRELYAVAGNIKKSELFTRALSVGKDHVSALVNTLVLAYVGVALPTILFFATATSPMGQIINSEAFAAEIVRTVLGSLGLILTVPLTTWLAVIFLHKTKGVEMTPEEKSHVHAHGHDHTH